MGAFKDLDLRIRRDFPDYLDAGTPYCKCGSSSHIIGYASPVFTFTCDDCCREFHGRLLKSGVWKMMS